MSDRQSPRRAQFFSGSERPPRETVQAQEDPAVRYAWVLAPVLFLTTAALAGELEGEVRLASPPAPRAKGPDQMFKGNESRYSNLRQVGYSNGRPDRNDGPSQLELAGQDEVQSVVLELVDGNGKLPLTPWLQENSYNVMAQKNKNFVPHVVVVPRGSRVFFQNADPFLHHIYSIGKDPRGFEIPEHSGKVSNLFAEPGVLELFCGLHPRMNAYVYVSQSNLACKPMPDHHYRLRNIPAGKYRLRCWHPRHPEKTLEVTVPEKGTVHLDVDL